MKFKVTDIDDFQREVKALAKKYTSLKSDLLQLVEVLEENPTTGTHLGKGIYKIRLSITSKGRGKSGGGSVVTLVRIVDKRVYLLSIYDKADKEDISNKELDALLKEVQSIVKGG